MSAMHEPGDDAGVLRALGVPDAPLLGQGGEARVYARDAQSVLRVLRSGATLAQQMTRAGLLSEIAAGAQHLPFATPRVVSVKEVEARVVVVERRLPGVPLSEALRTAQGQERCTLIAAYLDTAAQIGDIELSRDYFGDLVADPPLRRPSYRAYLADRIAQIQNRGGMLSDLLAGHPLASDMPDCNAGALVHLDMFPANVLVDGRAVSAVIDFGPSAVFADRRLDIWSAVAYLDPEISPYASDADRAFAQSWLAGRGLDADFPAARRWIAGYWCFADDDPAVVAWCKSVLARRNQSFRPGR